MPNFSEEENLGGAGNSGERSDIAPMWRTPPLPLASLTITLPITLPLPLALKDQHSALNHKCLDIFNHVSRLRYSWIWTSAEPLAQTFERNTILCAGVMLHRFLGD